MAAEKTSEFTLDATPGAGSYVPYVDPTEAADADKNKRILVDDLTALGSGIADVVEDTTPQLGGDLDLNGNVITGLVVGTDVQAHDAVLDATTASFTTADESKLAGIEAGADVTDTANVTAAGALMDSEVDADIKTLSLPASTTISAFGATLVDDADAATARTTLGASRVESGGVYVATLELDTDITAADVPFTPAGTIAATDVQAAIVEVAAEAGGGGGPTVIIKSADESVTSSTTVQPDNDLVLPIVTGETWVGEFVLFVESQPAADFKYSVIGSVSGITTLFSSNAQRGADQVMSGSPVQTETSTTVANPLTAGTNTPGGPGKNMVVIKFHATAATTDGNVVLQWAQAVSDATATKVLAGSHLIASEAS